MTILVIRHAIAENLEAFAKNDGEKESAKGKDDSQRPLTRKGRRRMRRAARGLRRLVPRLDVLATSPLVRAVETGDIVAGEYDGLSAVQIAPLSPRKSVTTLLHWLQQQPADSTVGLVGHEPHLGIFVGWMMTGLQESFVEFKKGGACLLKIDGEMRAARAKLVWLLKPSELRRLA